MELEDLLAVPGIGTLLEFAPIFGVTLWLLLTVILWKDGFNDLGERLVRPQWAGAARIQALAMIPLRALMLAGAAALGAAMTTIGLAFNIAVLLNLWNGARMAFSGS